MPLHQFTERHASREVDKDSFTFKYVAAGEEDSAAVRMAGFMFSPPMVATAEGIMYRQDVKVMSQGHDVYHVDVPYAPKSKSDKTIPVGTWTWDFNTQGGEFTIKTSKSTVAAYVAGGDAVIDHKNAINVGQDGKVEGTSIIIKSMKLNVSYKHPTGVVTLPFAMALADLTGMVNSTPMFNRPAGEVLFLGAEGSDGTEAEAVVKCAFAIEKNLQNKIIGGITVAQKNGWDYSWIEFKTAKDGGREVTVPRQINIERVYDRVDLAAALGFGG
jgi:hypothetical protein